MCPSNRIQETKKGQKEFKDHNWCSSHSYIRGGKMLHSMDNQRELFFEKGPAI